MMKPRTRTALGLGAVVAIAAGALLATEASTRAASTLTVVASIPKSDRLDAGTGPFARDKIDAAFAIAAAGSRSDLQIVTTGRAAEACMPDCSSVVFKSASPGEPSRIVPGKVD